MLKFDELNNNQSCFQKADMDEMLFVLRAQDVTAPATILEWMKINFESLPETKLREAFECALTMKRYKSRKSPD